MLHNDTKQYTKGFPSAIAAGRENGKFQRTWKKLFLKTCLLENLNVRKIICLISHQDWVMVSLRTCLDTKMNIFTFIYMAACSHSDSFSQPASHLLIWMNSSCTICLVHQYRHDHLTRLYVSCLNVLIVASRRGRSVQHSYRKHLGCGAAGGGVLQDEKREDFCSFCGPTVFVKYLSERVSPPPDVPGHPAGASALHPGQQLRRGAWLDRHPDQSQPVQPQTPEHVPPFSLPQRTLALLQAVSRHGSGLHALHRVRKSLQRQEPPHFSFPPSHQTPFCFQGPPSKHPAGRGRRQRDGEDLLPLQHIHDQTDQDARSGFFILLHICLFSPYLSLTLFFSPQRRAAVSPCTTGPNRRSTPTLSSTTPRRRTSPWSRSSQLCRRWSSSTPSTKGTSSRRPRSAASMWSFLSSYANIVFIPCSFLFHQQVVLTYKYSVDFF